MLPSDLARSLSEQWPCRELQIKQLASLLSPTISNPSTIVIHGISATCKSTIVRAVLAALKPPVPHAIIKSAECITGRHLLTKILLDTLSALGLSGEWERFGKGRCEHVSTLVVLLGEALAAAAGTDVNETRTGIGRAGQKFILVLDGIEKQREAPQTLLVALARLGEVIPSLCVVLILGSSPRPLFLQSAGVPHIGFPPYTRKEAISIILNESPPHVNGVSVEVATKLYPNFVATVYDSLVGPTAGTIPAFRSICQKLWSRFVAPIASDEAPPGGNSEWDFTRLLVRNRSLFRQQGESALVHHIVPEEDVRNKQVSSTSNTTSAEGPTAAAAAVKSIASSSSTLPSLPYFPILILTSAYLASHIPPRLDTIFFSKFSSTSLSARNKRSHHRRRLKLLSQAQAEDMRNGHLNNNDDDGDPATTPGGRKGKRQKTRITKSTLESAFATTSATTSAAIGGAGPGPGGIGVAGPSTILSARPFPLERLLAIYHAIDPNPPANPLRVTQAADMIYAELATLRRLRLVVPAAGRGSTSTSTSGAGGGLAVGSSSGGGGTTSSDVGEKWCVNVSGDWIGEMAKGIGVEVGEWLAGGLD